MRLARPLLFLALVPLFITCRTNRQTVNIPNTPDPRWAAIDSMSALGQYSTALQRTQAVLDEAAAAGDWRAEYRAWQYRTRFRAYTGADVDSSLLALEARARTATVPLKQVLHSTLATSWWQRYQNDRWRILERTAMAEEGTDPSTWSQGAFMRKVVGHFAASLTPADTLKVLPAEDLGELLVGDDAAARALRPTLFDILAHRAIDVFRNSETRITEPAWRFKLDDPKDFELFEPFVFRTLEHRDSSAWEALALRTYQQLEHLHLNDDTPDALVDVVLQRLAYVREHSVHAQKDTLYLNALNTLRSRLPNDTCWAEVTHAIAQWHREQGARYQRLGSDEWKWENRTARDLCNEGIARFPGSYGAAQCARLKAELQQPGLRIEVEAAVAPDERVLFALHYRNVKRIGVRVVKNPSAIDEEKRHHQELTKWLVAQKPVKEWTLELPDDGDLNEHLIEVPVDGLPFGAFTLLVANEARFNNEPGSFAHAAFQVTDFAVVQRRVFTEEELLVLDRTTGAVRAGVQVEQWSRANAWDPKERGARTAQTVTDAEGRVRFTANDARQYRYYTLQLGNDKFSTQQSWAHGLPRVAEQEELRTYLFTDRAIYRPGQELHFKGLVVAQKGKEAAVRAGHRTTVRFFDVNGQLIDSANVTTDAFGAFHGTFNTPMGGLTGGMRLEEAHGSAYVQVEEYKRPTFEIVFEPINSTPKLNDEATVSGIAKSYAGVPLDGAVVKWTVKRGVRMPWWSRGWRGMPWGQETEVASGEASCDAQGRFNIVFLAEADRAFARAQDPTFHFTISAAATDISGETQTGTTSLTVAHRSIDIALNIGDAIDRETMDNLSVTVRNLNGQEVDVPMDIRIVELVPPADAPRREPLWERPDRILESELPRTHLADEPMSWPVNVVVVERLDHRATAGPLSLIPLKERPVGMYRIEVEAKDPQGIAVKIAKLITLYDTAIQNTGFVDEAFHVEPVKVQCEPGEKAVLLLSSALPSCRVLMEVERDGRIAASRSFVLGKNQQRVELPVMESDRGGFAVHFVCVERGRVHQPTQWIDVPWSNKELQVEWMSFRDKLLPGAKEEWRLRITGSKKEKVAAQLLAVMYDASLDHFAPHAWSGFQWPMGRSQFGWQRSEPFGSVSGHLWNTGIAIPVEGLRDYPTLFERGYGRGYDYLDGAVMMRSEMGNVRMMVGGRGLEEAADMEAPQAAKAAPPAEIGEPEETRTEVPATGATRLRTDFRETAFFFPELLTDRDGSVVLRFTTPDALTRWKVLGMAHTKALEIAHFTKEATTSKPLMVVPNLPRFLRHGDRITLTTKINSTVAEVTGQVRLALFDPVSGKEITKQFSEAGTEQVFTAAPGASATAAWPITVPLDVEVVSVRIVATGAGFSDGEERPLPVLTNKVLVTESMPLALTKAGTKEFTLEKLVSTKSTTLQHRNLKLEFTPNPAWYAVQALPYLMEFPHECAEQTFSRYYANRLATHIVEQRPAVKRVFDAWTGEGGEGAFLSALEKNPELKNVVLEETPWVLNAKDEGERKRRVALFFDMQRMASEEAMALKKLRDMQLGNGAWPWWSGMRESRYITQHIVAGFGHLETLKAADTRGDGPSEQMVRKAVQWLDADVDREHKEFLRRTKPEDRATYVPNGTDVHLLYARSFFQRWPIDGATRTVIDFHLERCRATWVERSLQEQAMLALAFDRLGDKATAQLILKSLSERATRSEELGMYWKGFNAGTAWWDFPTETHALLVEAYHEVGNDKTSTDQLRQYLLMLKQTTDWKTTKATAEACYALLLTGDDWLEPKDMPTIVVGKERVKADKQEAGTGYFEKSWSVADVKPEMGRVTVTTASDGVQWGALHWQYLEQMDKVTAHESPFSIKKQVLLKRQSEAGAQLVAQDGAIPVVPGDRITIRIELRTDRYVDFVHLKDQRAAGLEPVEAISGYKWQGGLGYYQSIRDASMHFFFDRITPGTHVFEYDLKVTHAGDMSNGLTTAMCMYAPEFSSHSEGVRVLVK